MPLSADDLVQICVAMKPIIEQMADEAVEAAHSRVARAKRDLANPTKPPEGEPERYARRGYKVRANEQSPPSANLDQLMGRLSSERYQRQRQQDNSRLAADIAAASVLQAVQAGRKDDSVHFPTAYRKILVEVEKSRSETRAKYSKLLNRSFAPLTTAPPAESPPWSQRFTDLVARRTADYPGSLPSERHKLLNGIFSALSRGDASGIENAFTDDRLEAEDLGAIIFEIRKEATARADRRSRSEKLSFSVVYRQELDSMFREDRDRFRNAMGGDWQRRQLDYGQLR